MSDTPSYEEIAPPPSIAGMVRCIWRLEGGVGVTTAEPIIPDGCTELILNFGDPFVRHTEAGSHRQPAQLFAGQITRAIEIEPTGRIDLGGIRFQPWASAAVLGFSASEAQDCLTSLDEHSPLAAHLFTSVAERHTDSGQVDAITDVLTWYVQRRLHCIARFQHALVLRRAHPDLSWSAIASRAGYFDQAHLIHDARDIAGRTPTVLVGGLTEIFLASGDGCF